MLPFLLIVAAIGADRLLLSDRWRPADPVGRRRRTWRPRIIGYVRSAPATYTYVAVLFLTSWILETSSSRVGRSGRALDRDGAHGARLRDRSRRRDTGHRGRDLGGAAA